MSLEQMIENAESLTKAASRSFNPNAYNKLIVPDNQPLHLSFLVDRKRAIKFASHWNDELKCMDLCEKTYGRECTKYCKKGDKPTYTVEFLAFNYEKVDSMREAKSSGEIYQENPVCIYSQRSGRNEINFQFIQDLNGDLDQYYDVAVTNGKKTFTLRADSLKENELLFDIDSGNHKIFKIIKAVSAGKGGKKSTEYAAPAVVSRTQMEKLLPEKKGKLLIPADIREGITLSYTMRDCLPHYLAHYGNVDWEAWGVSAPEEGTVLFGKVESKAKASGGNAAASAMADANEAL